MAKLPMTQRCYIRKKQIIIEMGGGCTKCGYHANLASLDFHHLDESAKAFDLNSRAIAYAPWEEVKAELAKCVVLCRNCHSELHHPTGTWDEVPDISVDFERPRKRKTLCADCGRELMNPYVSIRCPTCKDQRREKADWPDIDALIQEVQETSSVAVAKRLGVTPQAVRARIKRRKAKGQHPPAAARICSLCNRKHYAKGLCQYHWAIQRRIGADLIQIAQTNTESITPNI